MDEKMNKRGRKTRQQIMEYIKAYIQKHRYAPALREVSEGVGLSLSSTRGHINKLLAAGELETDHPGAPRALRVAEKDSTLIGARPSGCP